MLKSNPLHYNINFTPHTRGIYQLNVCLGVQISKVGSPFTLSEEKSAISTNWCTKNKNIVGDFIFHCSTGIAVIQPQGKYSLPV